MLKFSNPIFIFMSIVLGLILILLKIKISLLLNIAPSLIFAIGVFLVTLAFGLLFFNYLVSENIELAPDVASEKKDSKENKKIENAKISKVKEIKFTQKVKATNTKKVVSDEKQKIVEPKIELKEEKEKPKVEKKIEEVFLPSTINKTKILNLFIALTEDVISKRTDSQKLNRDRKLIIFFAVIVILSSFIFLALKYSLLDFTKIGLILGFDLFLIFIIFRNRKIQKKALKRVDVYSERLLNLERTTKRFKSISPRNVNVLKNTIDSLSSESKDYIYTKIKK